MDCLLLQLQAEFETLLRNNAVPTGLHPLYKNWLRFYLDFCRKYHFSEKERKSLEHFLRKLQEKKQTEVQQQQASHAIHFNYGLGIEEVVRFRKQRNTGDIICMKHGCKRRSKKPAVRLIFKHVRTPLNLNKILGGKPGQRVLAHHFNHSGVSL